MRFFCDKKFHCCFQVIPALSAFCAYAALGILGLYGLVSTFFVACLTLDQRRVEQSRDAFLFCYVHKDYVPNKFSQMNLVQSFVEKVYAPTLMKLSCKVIYLFILLEKLAVLIVYWLYIFVIYGLKDIQSEKENWAASQQNQQNYLCAQWRLRSAWASAQSDQSLWAHPPSLIRVFERTAKTDQTGYTGHFVGFVMQRLIYLNMFNRCTNIFDIRGLFVNYWDNHHFVKKKCIHAKQTIQLLNTTTMLFLSKVWLCCCQRFWTSSLVKNGTHSVSEHVPKRRF